MNDSPSVMDSGSSEGRRRMCNCFPTDVSSWKQKKQRKSHQNISQRSRLLQKLCSERGGGAWHLRFCHGPGRASPGRASASACHMPPCLASCPVRLPPCPIFFCARSVLHMASSVFFLLRLRDCSVRASCMREEQSSAASAGRRRRRRERARVWQLVFLRVRVRALGLGVCGGGWVGVLRSALASPRPFWPTCPFSPAPSPRSPRQVRPPAGTPRLRLPLTSEFHRQAGQRRGRR